MSLQPCWKKRKKNKSCFDFAKSKGFTGLISHLLSSRYQETGTLELALFSELKDLDRPDSLPDIEIAANRLVSAILNQEIIGIETDHDADGVTSHAVIYEALTQIMGHPANKVRSYIGHRLKEGYGLSDSVATRILNDEIRPTLIITADNGSSDEKRIARLKAHNIDVIVTDHHEIPEEGIPQSAIAVISPARLDSEYPDRMIAGCMSACLLMAAARQALINKDYFKVPPKSLSTLFDFVALGTVADCVSMSQSKNNRLIVKHGLKLINKMQRPCWQALKPYLSGDPNRQINAEDLGFTIAPRINARGRLDEAMTGVHFLLSRDIETATKLAVLLDSENNERKKIEKRLKEASLKIAQPFIDENKNSLVIYLEDGHPGVHGIVASRLVEAFGRPVINLSPKEGGVDLVSGSARGIPGFHVREALNTINQRYPDLIIAFGGHKGAAGLTLKKQDIETFRQAFEDAVNEQIARLEIKVGPVLMIDNELPHSFITLNTLAEIEALEPFGREMDSPVFTTKFKVKQSRRIGSGDVKNHVKLKLKTFDSSEEFNAVWFNVDPDCELETLKVNEGAESEFAYSISKNYYQGQTTLQLMIKGVR